MKGRGQGLSDQGYVRDHNEDSFLVLNEQQLWLVADGMGGHRSGDVASQMIKTALSHYRNTGLLGLNVAQVAAYLKQVNAELTAMAARQNSIIGSTVVILISEQNHGVCLWVGDSRLYRYRQGDFIQISRDHNSAEEMIEQGMEAQLAWQSPYAQALTRAVGGDAELMLSKQIIEIRPGDRYLLCSDGLNKELNDAEIAALLEQPEPSAALVHAALQKHARDNITAVVVEFH